MNLRIIKAGLLDTIQDVGRYGSQHLGINPSGAMDKLSAQVANILVGNDSNEAVIELHFPASSFFFEQPTLIAVSGADFSASINGEEVPSLHPILVSKYSILQFHGIKNGARAYLAVHGGLNLSKWLDSYSTHIKAVAGGHKGRALQKDDEIGFRIARDLCQLIDKKEYIVLPWQADTPWNYDHTEEIYVLPGNEWDTLTDTSKEKFTQQSFIISTQSDRMGYQLKSEPLLRNTTEEIVSSGVNFGTIQLLPGAQLIILMADHQTTGGYPKVAHVITAHHSKLAQMKPGDAIHFQFTDLTIAEDLFIKQQRHLQQLQDACTFRLQQFMNA
ncbi:MAG TPA: biotin-dependent carboxyltransferase family protein [Chitinophagaceae bacterium]